MMPITIKDFPARLEAFLAEKIGRPVTVSGARQLTGGASRDTWLVDAAIEGNGSSLALVVRRDMGGEIMPDALDRAAEFAVLRRAFENDVRVPKPRWLCMDPTILGAPFFIMDRLEGESVGRRVVRDPTLANARTRLARQLGEQLARIHALPVDGLDGLPCRGDGCSPAQAALEQAGAHLQALGEPHPALELALRWLANHAPKCEKLVLVHGDFRVGNLLIGTEGLVGVIDWEFAHVGDPMEDLAWPCVRSWRFGQDDLTFGGVGRAEDFFAAYEAAGGVKVDQAALRFWELLGNLRWAIGCVAQAHRHLSGQASSVELASLGRRTCEMELELLDLMRADGL